MKNRFHQILFLSLFCFSSVSAQEFNAAAHFGISGSQLDGDLLSGYTKLGLRAGIQIEREINDRTTWYFGMQYHNKGSQKELRINNINQMPIPFRTISLHYIDLPLAIAYQQNEKIILHTGLTLGYLVSSRIRNEPGQVADFRFKTIESGILLGYQIPFSANFSGAMFFQYSLFSTAPGPWYLPSFSVIDRVGQFNNCISITLIYHFKDRFDL